MDLGALERSLAAAGAVLADPRLVRRVIKRHRGLAGIGLSVPHARCYVLSRAALLAIVDARELGLAGESLPDEVILLPRPVPGELGGATHSDLLRVLWRSSFHAHVHLEIDRRAASGVLTEATIRERIHVIGETEFDEVRRVLRNDDLLLPPYDNRGAFTEFAALYLELRHFAPTLLPRVFPTLFDQARVDATLALDIDAPALLERSRPTGAAPLAPAVSVRDEAASIAPPPPPGVPSMRGASSQATFTRRMTGAAVARAKGNVVRAALLHLGARDVAPEDREASALDAAREDMESLANRLVAALADDGLDVASCSSLFLALAERAGGRDAYGATGEAPGPSPRALTPTRITLEARVLYDLQSACTAAERPLSTIDLVEWALSLGRRPVVRALPSTREVRIAREVHGASVKAASVRLSGPQRARLERLLQRARERAEANVRAALHPRILAALGAVGLRPASAPERVALSKLTEEILDQAVEHGFVNIGHLRDAISRNQLKLDDLTPRELFVGDALLAADRLLAESIDGVYRRAEIYLRSLQRLSSIAFGTRPGRLAVLYPILPALMAFVLLEGTSHLVKVVTHELGHKSIHLLSKGSFVATALVIFALLHSTRLRAVVVAIGSAIGRVASNIFVGFPVWVAHRPVVLAVVQSRLGRAVGRYLLLPLTFAVLLFWATPLRKLERGEGLGGALMIFVAANVLMNSKPGRLVEEITVDWIVRQWTMVSRRILPGLFRLVADAFRGGMELLDRVIYKIDEQLRFREGAHPLALAGKAVVGVVWFLIAYLLRFYTNLLIEPQINPIKHFPVVTVSHKLMLPFDASIARAIEATLHPFGALVANSVAASTVLLFPGVFGFLVWELKENFRLYRASRPAALAAVSIGHHGETMGALMKPGFHSGTLPKLHAKLRRAAEKGDKAVAHHIEALHDVEAAVIRFVERDFAALLAEASRWTLGPVTVVRAHLGSNRVRVELSCASVSPAPCWIAFEEQSGMIVASVPQPGWIDGVTGAERTILENAVAGLYHLAGVDMVREQVEAAFAGAPPYDVSDAGIVVWPGQGYRTEVVYRFAMGSELVPSVRGELLGTLPETLDAGKVLYRRQSILWVDWVAAWDAACTAGAVIPRVLAGASILPDGRIGGASVGEKDGGEGQEAGIGAVVLSSG